MTSEQFASLSDLLNKSGIGKSRYLNNYSVEDIIKSAIATLEKTGRRPTGEDGEVLYGPLAGKATWPQLNRAKAIKDAGYKSLSHLLDKNEIGSPYHFKDYTIDDIESAARSYVEEHGKTPNNKSGKISYSPFKNLTSWQAVGKSKPLKEAGYKSITDFCKKKNIGKPSRFTNYTIEDISNAVKTYFQEHGKRPLAKKERIPYPPFNNRTNWINVSSSQNLKNAGYTSLHNFCDSEKIGRATTFTNYTINDIEAATRAYLKEHGKRPTNKKISIPYSPFNNRTNWENVSISSVLKDAGYTSLSNFCEKNNIGSATHFRKYTIKDIETAARAYLKGHGEKPSTKAGKIPYPPFNNEITWNSINQSRKLKDVGYKSLKDFCEKNNIGQSRFFTDYTIQDVESAVRAHIKEHGKRPARTVAKIPYPPFNNRASWEAVNQAKQLREAGYTSLKDFCMKNNINTCLLYTSPSPRDRG